MSAGGSAEGALYQISQMNHHPSATADMPKLVALGRLRW
jgi:hypothetical protein